MRFAIRLALARVNELDIEVVFKLVEVNGMMWWVGDKLGVRAGGEVLRLRLVRVRALPPVVDALVVVERVEGPEDLVAERAASGVQRLQVLLLGVALECEPRRQQLAAHLAPVPGPQRTN